MLKFLVINIGCSECGIPTDVVDLFDTEEEAKGRAKECNGLYHTPKAGCELCRQDHLPLKYCVYQKVS